MTNLGPPSQWLEDNNNTEQAVNEVAVAGSSEESRDDMPQSDNDTVSETTSSNPPKTGKKSKSRAQVEREELADKIINFASKEDHPSDLELAALCSKIKRKLPDPDDQMTSWMKLRMWLEPSFRGRNVQQIVIVQFNQSDRHHHHPLLLFRCFHSNSKNKGLEI